ncbi:hypothetical protein CWIS_09735 [Cellulomonas sp. A375-1]|uniref:hypothetical protein n=1 Tax=Cellulomonas sp. A375-1 TaxID=1672219 RepID=UPI00065278D0|nr:hypothetical protein [Cellulomonas sp. A375-1]KMM45611.1 hypothetical protein CWIS_09735 [Cellulomonas sp. A375-1]
MGKGIQVPLVAETSQTIKAVQDLGSAFGDVSGSLVDLQRDAQRTGRELEDTLADKTKDGAREAEKSVDRLERSFRDLAQTGRKTGRETRDALGDDVADGARRSSEAVAEFKDEARQNFGEITSSFSGEMDSLVDLAQGTAGGLAGSLSGPVGLAFGGLAASAGLFYNAWKTNTEKVKQAVSDMYNDLKESGADALSETFVQSEIEKIVTDAEGKVISFAEAQKYAATTGVDLATVLRAVAGDTEAWSAVQDAVNAKIDENAAAFGRTDEIMRQTGESYDTVRQRLVDEQTALEEVNGRLNENATNREKATAAVEAARSAQKASAETARDAADAEASYRESLAASSDAIKENAGDVQKNRGVVLDAIRSAIDYTSALRDNGAEASQVADAQKAMYSQLVDVAEQTGLSTSEARDLINTFLDFPKDIETGVVLDDADALTRLHAIQDANYTTTITPEVDLTQAEKDLRVYLARTRKITVGVTHRVGTSVVV